jgi:uncharacterized membrane protein (UPF0127 family)
MKFVCIQNPDTPFDFPIRAKYCVSFWCRLKGLMFEKHIDQSQGVLFVNPTESRIDASIHMFFMNFEILVVWLNSEFEVVDLRIAQRWQPLLVPAKPAKFILELHRAMHDKIAIGTKLDITHV